MITEGYSRYQLNAEQFNNLFTDNINNKTLNVLSELAADGNLDCIDMLHNLALRYDNVGERAENILFNLFSGKSQGKKGIDEEIKLASMKLYETACNAKEKNSEDMRKFHSSSKLLYMAGSAMTNKAQKQDVSAIFSKGMEAQSEFEKFEYLDLWSNARMLMTDEINSAMNNITQKGGNLSLNFPIGLIEPVKKTNMLSDQILEKILTENKFDKPEVFPVNTGGHWVLFVLYNGGFGRDTKCVVFNSVCELNDNIKKELSDSAEIAGVSEGNIEFIDGDMQTNVPNGCGVFVIKAMDLLSHATEKNPLDTLKEFTDNFANLSVEEQTLFNIQSRRQFFEHSIL